MLLNKFSLLVFIAGHFKGLKLKPKNLRSRGDVAGLTLVLVGPELAYKVNKVIVKKLKKFFHRMGSFHFSVSNGWPMKNFIIFSIANFVKGHFF